MKKLVKHMSIDDGRFMVGIMNAGDSSEPRMYLDFSKDLTQKRLLDEIDMLKKEGALYSFNIAAYRQAGYEVRSLWTYTHKKLDFIKLHQVC